MTPVQQARVRGFQIQLTQRGVTLTTEAGQTFQALIERRDSGLDDFENGPAQRTSRVIHVLRETFSGLQGVDERSKLTDKAGKSAWVVAWIQDDPINIAVELTCNMESK